MAVSSPHISDVHILELLNEKLKYSSEAMSEIDNNVIQHIYSVRDALGRQLHHIRMKLDEAEARLDQAERAESACHARQHRNQDGDLVPSCSFEESAAAAALKEVKRWRGKKSAATRVFEECQQEIASYLSEGHQFIRNMCEQKTSKASQSLCDCIEKLQEILKSDVMI